MEQGCKMAEMLIRGLLESQGQQSHTQRPRGKLQRPQGPYSHGRQAMSKGEAPQVSLSVEASVSLESLNMKNDRCE